MRSSFFIMNEISRLGDQVNCINAKLVESISSIQEFRNHCQYWDEMEQRSGGNAELHWRIRFESYESSGFSSGGTTNSFEIDGVDGESGNLISSRHVSCVLASLAEVLELEKDSRISKIEELIEELKETWEREINESL